MLSRWERLLELVSGAARFDGSVRLGVVSDNSRDLKKRLRIRGCGFTFRLAWEASRSRPVMGLLTLWRSKLQLVTSLIEPFSTLFSFSLSCCPSSSFSLLSLRLKVSTNAPPWVLSLNLLINLSFWLTFMLSDVIFRLIVMDLVCFLGVQLWNLLCHDCGHFRLLQQSDWFLFLFNHETTVDDKSNLMWWSFVPFFFFFFCQIHIYAKAVAKFSLGSSYKFQWNYSVMEMSYKIWWLAMKTRKIRSYFFEPVHCKNSEQGEDSWAWNEEISSNIVLLQDKLQ